MASTDINIKLAFTQADFLVDCIELFHAMRVRVSKWLAGLVQNRYNNNIVCARMCL